MKKDIKRYEILKRSWKTRSVNTDGNHLDNQTVIVTLMDKINQDPRSEQ
jgi:hypothetical protein